MAGQRIGENLMKIKQREREKERKLIERREIISTERRKKRK